MLNKIFFQTTRLGELVLKNKFVMAPMTRMRADQPSMVPNDIMVEYYAQRASFGLILTECSQISPLSNGFPGSGGIYNSQQMEGWKRVTEAVHKKGGLIMLQIWHCGRAANSSHINGQLPIAPSPIPIQGTNFLDNNQPYPVPREMNLFDIEEVINQFKESAKLAKLAGFDGVELHGGNGYLVDQFLRDYTNKRSDNYGGSKENRSRFCLEIVDTLVDVFGSGRVAIRLSPAGRVHDMYDSNPYELMKYLLPELDKRKLAFVELKRYGIGDKKYPPNGRVLPTLQIPDYFNALRPLYKGNIIANDGLTIEEARSLLQNDTAQAASFGTLSISNPDLPERVLNEWDINNKIDYKTWLFGGSKGYTDFPHFSQSK